MGRNPELIEKKRSRGTVRKVREAGKGNIPAMATTVKISVPAWMRKDQRKTFKAITRILGDWGILQLVDLGLIEAYVAAMSSFRDNQLLIQECGAYVEKLAPNGSVIGQTEAPWSKAAKEDARLIKDLGAKLGFSPVDRARILAMIAPKQEEKDDFAEFVEV